MELTRFCKVACQVVYFLPSHPSLTIEPGHFLKIYGEILPCSRLSDTTRFSTLLDYWRIVADPFLSDIHCMTRFSHMPFPHDAQLSSLCVTYQISLHSFLGEGGWRERGPQPIKPLWTKRFGSTVHDETTPFLVF